jgi:hypothetical protein
LSGLSYKALAEPEACDDALEKLSKIDWKKPVLFESSISRIGNKLADGKIKTRVLGLLRTASVAPTALATIEIGLFKACYGIEPRYISSLSGYDVKEIIKTIRSL